MTRRTFEIVQTFRMSEENSYIIIGISQEGRIASCRTFNDDMISKEAGNKLSEIEFIIRGLANVN